MGKLLTTFLEADTALRAWVMRAGSSEATRKLAVAITQLRRVAAAHALAEAAAGAAGNRTTGGSAATPDPKADFTKLVEIAATAGLAWQDMAAIVNRAHERNPRNG